MDKPDPYEPPRTVETKPVQSNLRSLVVPACCGAIVSEFVLSPFISGPAGHSIAAGLGGLIALIGAIVVRSLNRSRR